MTILFFLIITANRVQELGSEKSAKWTAEPGPSSSELHHSAAIYNHQYKQENSHRLQHFQWQVSGEPGEDCRAGLLWTHSYHLHHEEGCPSLSKPSRLTSLGHGKHLCSRGVLPAPSAFFVTHPLQPLSCAWHCTACTICIVEPGPQPRCACVYMCVVTLGK